MIKKEEREGKEIETGGGRLGDDKRMGDKERIKAGRKKRRKVKKARRGENVENKKRKKGVKVKRGKMGGKLMRQIKGGWEVEKRKEMGVGS